MAQSTPIRSIIASFDCSRPPQHLTFYVTPSTTSPAALDLLTLFINVHRLCKRLKVCGSRVCICHTPIHALLEELVSVIFDLSILRCCGVCVWVWVQHECMCIPRDLCLFLNPSLAPRLSLRILLISQKIIGMHAESCARAIYTRKNNCPKGAWRMHPCTRRLERRERTSDTIGLLVHPSHGERCTAVQPACACTRKLLDCMTVHDTGTGMLSSGSSIFRIAVMTV